MHSILFYQNLVKSLTNLWQIFNKNPIEHINQDNSGNIGRMIYFRKNLNNTHKKHFKHGWSCRSGWTSPNFLQLLLFVDKWSPLCHCHHWVQNIASYIYDINKMHWHLIALAPLLNIDIHTFSQPFVHIGSFSVLVKSRFGVYYLFETFETKGREWFQENNTW